jgi:hypothetical protein
MGAFTPVLKTVQGTTYYSNEFCIALKVLHPREAGFTPTCCQVAKEPQYHQATLAC